MEGKALGGRKKKDLGNVGREKGGRPDKILSIWVFG